MVADRERVQTRTGPDAETPLRVESTAIGRFREGARAHLEHGQLGEGLQHDHLHVGEAVVLDGDGGEHGHRQEMQRGEARLVATVGADQDAAQRLRQKEVLALVHEEQRVLVAVAPARRVRDIPIVVHGARSVAQVPVLVLVVDAAALVVAVVAVLDHRVVLQELLQLALQLVVDEVPVEQTPTRVCVVPVPKPVSLVVLVERTPIDQVLRFPAVHVESGAVAVILDSVGVLVADEVAPVLGVRDQSMTVYGDSSNLTVNLLDPAQSDASCVE